VEAARFVLRSAVMHSPSVSAAKRGRAGRAEKCVHAQMLCHAQAGAGGSCGGGVHAVIKACLQVQLAVGTPGQSM